MKLIYKTLLCLLVSAWGNAQTSTAQKFKSEPFGGDNSHLVINNQFNPFAYNYFRMLDYRIECFGYYSDIFHYSFSREGKYFTFGISDQLDIVYIKEVNIPTKYNEPIFIGSIRLNEFVNFFVDVKSDEFPKGTRALYCMTLDLEERSFLEPQFVATFESKTKLNAHLIKSPDEKRLGITIISDFKKGDQYLYNLVTFDEELQPLLIEKNITGEFESKHFYSTSFINDAGEITLVYAENGGKFSKSSGIEKSHRSAILFTHNGKNVKQSDLKLKDRTILDIQPTKNGHGEQFFVSWAHALNTGKTGFSLVNPTTLNEQIITEFDNKWVEPFIALEINEFVDKAYSYKKNDVLHAHYRLLDIIEDEKTNTYILEKNSKVEFFAADYGATIVPIKNTNTSTTINGDIIIIQTNLAGTVIDSAKIERNLIHGINSGHVHTFKKSNRYDLIYSDMIKNDGSNNGPISSQSNATKSVYKGKPENYQFLVTKIEIKNTGINLLTHPMNHFNLEYKATQFIPYTETCAGKSEDFTVVAFVENGVQIIRLLY